MEKFNTIELGQKRIAEILVNYPEFDQINAIKDGLAGIKDATPDQVTRAASDISVLLCRFGSLVTQLSAEANEAYSYRKMKMVWEFSRLSKNLTAKERENTSMEATCKEVREELIKRFIADFFKEYKDDISRLVSVLQSRIKILSQERFEAGANQH